MLHFHVLQKLDLKIVCAMIRDLPNPAMVLI